MAVGSSAAKHKKPEVSTAMSCISLPGTESLQSENICTEGQRVLMVPELFSRPCFQYSAHGRCPSKAFFVQSLWLPGLKPQSSVEFSPRNVGKLP